MSKLGYSFENWVQKELTRCFPDSWVFKLAQWQIFDYLLVEKGRVKAIVEAKQRKKKYYYSENKEQWENINKIAKELNVPVWFYLKEGKNIRKIVNPEI